VQSDRSGGRSGCGYCYGWQRADIDTAFVYMYMTAIIGYGAAGHEFFVQSLDRYRRHTTRSGPGGRLGPVKSAAANTGCDSLRQPFGGGEAGDGGRGSWLTDDRPIWL
jgi:hypothetical protein